MYEIPHAFVVPHMATRRHKKRLAWRDWVEADTAFTAVHTHGIRVSVLLLVRMLLQQSPVRACVEVVQTLLPAAIALNPDLDASEDDLLTTLEVNAELYNIAIVDWVGSRFLTRTL